jgi:hypothetical protein
VQTPAGFYAEAAGEDAPCQVTERAGRTVHSAHARTAAGSSKTLSLMPVLLPHGTARPTGRGCRKTAVFLQRMILAGDGPELEVAPYTHVRTTYV